MNCIVQVFAKAPVAGEVKTRLYPLLSFAQAADLHACLVAHTLAMTSTSGLTVQLWGSDEHVKLRDLAGKFKLPLFIQQGRQLGERMGYAAAQGLQIADAVIIIGSDCPALDSVYLDAAIAALKSHPVVLGPAVDGGYVLIGLKQADPQVFADVDWGSGQVLEQTRRNLQRSATAWFELETLADIDRPEDLVNARARWPALFALAK